MQFIIPTLAVFMIILFVVNLRKERDFMDAVAETFMTSLVVVCVMLLILLGISAQLKLMGY